jgi:hypothetical protein
MRFLIREIFIKAILDVPLFLLTPQYRLNHLSKVHIISSSQNFLFALDDYYPSILPASDLRGERQICTFKISSYLLFPRR